MENKETQKKPRATKVKFGDVKKLDLKKNDGTPLEIDHELCYFNVRDYAYSKDDDIAYTPTLMIMTPTDFLKKFSPFSKGRPLHYMLRDSVLKDLVIEYTTSIKGLLTLKNLVDTNNTTQLRKEFGLSLQDTKLITSIQKEFKYLSINGAKSRRLLIKDLIQVVDVDGKEIFKSDLK